MAQYARKLIDFPSCVVQMGMKLQVSRTSFLTMIDLLERTNDIMQLDDSGDVFRYNFHGFPHLQIIRDDLVSWK